ncbi:helix-turn-helix domain-containing protein [Aliarcobacter butzleri]|uniref:helix-turn-helix domain-containing protein n=1 Tax=Aliarcobacter butzleri TaxID=28197 RepID=UPI0021B603D8|nr:helix-turn-helix domain-containing protein [Aliarcobacter butzleri]MCT7642617.1 helix-turn-helix domain-containing protein [Aliarcobacter butzleri]
MNNIDKRTITIKELSKRLNISEQTYHNWKKEKPELIKLINMGLDMEKLLKKYNIK